MRLVSKLLLSVGGLLAIALLGAALTAWSVYRAAVHLERLDVAHQVYEGYLSLSSHTYQLFKQFGDGLLIGDLDQGAGESALVEAIRADITRIREMIGREIELVGEEEIEELEHLARIEVQIETLLAEYWSIMEVTQSSPLSENWGRLSRMLDQSIDQDFNAMIRTAIDDEIEEVRDTRARSTDKIRLLSVLAALFALLAITATVLGVRMLLRDISGPIEKLRDGAVALERGDLDFRVEVGGPVELSDLGDAFNGMATQISAREKVLEDSNANLEQTIASRTAELRRLLAAVEDGEARRRRLLADVSHELRTPLTIIRGEADIALRGEPKTPEVYRDALARCLESADHTARLVDDLLLVARGESGEIRLDFAEMDLAEMLPRVVDECRSLANGESGCVTFVTTLESARLRADEQRLRQVMLILLENAFRYGGSKVQVHLASVPTGFTVSVSDDGPGMTTEERDSAFERFFRGSNAAARYDRGAGLGLPVAKTIVEAHEGTISLGGEPGAGLVVSFTLPGRPLLRAVS